MLLRRVAEHVRAQNWTAVVIDFFIVVVGILLAFQITDWNEQRQNDDLRSLYLSQLVEDLREDVIESERVKNIALLRMAAIEDMLSDTWQGQLSRRYEDSSGVIEFDAYDPYDVETNGSGVIFDMPRFVAARDTYSAIVSNGDFKLIDSPSLVRHIQGYYGTSEESGRLEVATDRVFWYVAESYFRLGLNGASSFDDLADALRTDSRIVSELESYWYYSGYQSLWMNELTESANNLIEAIESEK